MSKVLSPHKQQQQQQMVARQRPRRESEANDAASEAGDMLNLRMEEHLNALDYTSSSSIIEFLAKEQDCNIEPGDPDIIFREVSRLSDSNDTRSVDELLQEAERLIQQQLRLGGNDAGGDLNGIDGLFTADRQTPSSTSPLSLSSPQNSIKLNTRYTRSIEHVAKHPSIGQTSVDTSQTRTHSPQQTQMQPERAQSPVPVPAPAPAAAAAAQTPKEHSNCGGSFVAFVDSLPSESIISEESTPKEMVNHTTTAEAMAQLQLEQLDNTDDDEDTMEEITEAEDCAATSRRNSSSTAPASAGRTSYKPIAPMTSYSEKAVGSSPKHLVSTLSSPIEPLLACSVSREHALKHEIEQLQERLKDTEERLASVRLQSGSLSQTQRALREQNGRLQEESEILKLDVQHLHECAGVLRTELQAARRDRDEALQLERTLRAELKEAQQERRNAVESKEKDARIIQDLQRQCHEMERILIRKHPDSVSALIVASKHPGICSLNDQENVNSRKLLEQRIAQLESDAKEQDRKAQQILANVQARFNSVQAKYETHIGDLETQVLNLQEINTKLNEQIESQVRTLDRYRQRRSEKYYNNCTQTEPMEGELPQTTETKASTGTTTGTQTQSMAGAMRDHSTNTIGCPSPSVICQQHLQQHQHQQQQQLHSAGSSSTSSTANSTPNTSRPNSKQSGTQRRSTIGSKLPISQSDSTLSLLSHGQAQAQAQAQGQGYSAAKEESQLLSSVRSMRVDLAIKNKAMQRLTRELDDCKKTIRKLQRDRESGPSGLSSAAASRLDSKLQGSTGSVGSGVSGISASGSALQRHYIDHIPATTETQALKEAHNKYHLLQSDYKTLHDKRLQDLKTLQSAHERELASCNETVRILQQRLNEREEAYATQKRRKVPGDYYALKAKVSLLERRHSEREERLHMLVEALSKGRLNGALEDMLQENNNK